MLELVTLPAAFGMRNVSPFCLKMEWLLHQLELEFTHTELADPRKAPKGKLPFLNITEGGTTRCIADSELITEFLDEHTQGRVYAGLTAQEKAQGVALARLCEDHLYWMIVASRWLDEGWFANVIEGFFHIAPKPIRGFVARSARKQVQQTYNLQGLGRHSFEEQQGFASRDLQALNDAVPAQGFLFGPQPCIYDFTIASIMAGLLDNKPATWLTNLAQPYSNLISYTERLQEHMGIYGRER